MQYHKGDRVRWTSIAQLTGEVVEDQIPAAAYVTVKWDQDEPGVVRDEFVVFLERMGNG